MPRALRRLVRSGRSDAPGAFVDALGRVGLVGYGLVHLVVAWLGVQLAFGTAHAPADAQGAVGVLARTAAGIAALAAAAVGLVAFAIWQLAAAAVGFRWVSGGERMRKRVGAVSKSIAMVALAVVIVDYLLGLHSSASASSLGSRVLALPAGRVLLGLVGLIVLIIAGTMVYTGVRRTFMGDLDVHRVSPAARRAIEMVGAVGHLARAAALGVVGFLIGAAAFWRDTAQLGGIDRALRLIGSTGPGRWLLVVVAIGFAAFGVYCMVDAATRRA